VWYRGSVEVGIEQTQADPATAEIEICKGVITRFYRLFPPGCGGEVFLQVFHQQRQVFPTTPGQAYLGDDSEMLAFSSVDIPEPPYVLTLKAWAPDSVYAHVIYCEFYIEHLQVLLPKPLEQIAIPGG